MKKSYILPVVIICFFMFLLHSCKRPTKPESGKHLFSLVPADSSGIHFQNEIMEDENVNPLQYENSYNGGGVAIGDINNDGLDDLCFTSNRNGNRLYLNLGDFKFEDITNASGIEGRKSWSTGVTMADVNGDGLLDIYVCHSGNLRGSKRANELFINKGPGKNNVPVFSEEAIKVGLADTAFSIQAAFFDYDLDKDLDMILLNHSPVRFNNLDETAINHLMNLPDSLTGLKLYRNDAGFFREVTRQSGLKNTRLNFNLGVSVADINNDGLQDIYITNDYLAPDYMFMNKGGGQFVDEISERLSVTSQFSMGVDIADINNDGHPEIYTLDMLPEGNQRQKLLFSSDNFELFEMNVKAGLHKQYMRNMLHLNNGKGAFSEVGQMAGISNTDWSWAPLLADFDNDGMKDVFVSNGYLRDYTNLDFLKYMGEYLRDNQGRIQKSNLLELVKKMPASAVRNYSFRNTGNIQFENTSSKWGLDAISNSNGAAYGDLDNDGDLDLVVNNINETAFLYRNNSEAAGHHYLSIKLVGEAGNNFGIGTKLFLHAGAEIQVQEQLMARGFQSSVSPVLIFGLGSLQTADSLVVRWPGKKVQVLRNVKSDQQLVLKESDAAIEKPTNAVAARALFFLQNVQPVKYVHEKAPVNDFKRQSLLINPLSSNGPFMASADINGDGKNDLYIGGAAGSAGQIHIGKENGLFENVSQDAFEADAGYEDATAVFFDANTDGFMDLFVGSGGYDSFDPLDARLKSRLYINNGAGKFIRDVNAIPEIISSVGTVAAGDVNGDGFKDLFMGGRVIPGKYPEMPGTYLLLNNGKGKFTDGTMAVCPALSRAGMFTSSVFADMDNDGKEELITAGDWLPLQIWKVENGKLFDVTSRFMQSSPSGWWNTLQVKDLNHDGKPDIIAGNYGLNCQWRASGKEPVEMFYKDFDNNGSVDPVFCFYIQGKSYPYVGRDELLDQISVMRSRFTDYKSYADAQLENIFSQEELKDVKKRSATHLETTIWVSDSTGKLSQGSLPKEAQFSPIFAISVHDFNGDGNMDLLLGGNINAARVKTGSNNSNKCQLFLGKGDGSFHYVPQAAAGLSVEGQIRSFSIFDNMVFIGIHNQPLLIYGFKSPEKK